MNKQPKCKHCKEYFIPANNKSLQKYCFKDECMDVWLSELRIYNQKQQEKKKREQAKKWSKEKKEIKENLKTHAYLQNELQPIINKIAREIDEGYPCMMCGTIDYKGWNNRKNGCHYHSVGSNNSLRFNLFNIWLGCWSCNGPKGGGNINGYDLQLIKHLGHAKWEFIKFELPKIYPEIKLSKEDLREKIAKAKKILNFLKTDDGAEEIRISGRWQSRNEINQELGIYSGMIIVD